TAEPDHHAPNVGLEDVTRGDTRVPPDDSAKGAAARHAILSADWCLRVGFRTMAVISYPVPVLHPLPDVPQRVVQSKSVRLFLTYGMGLTSRIVPEPGNLNQRAIPAGSISGAGRVFPFRLCRQAIMVAVPLAIDHLTKLLRVFPAHSLNREIRALGI